MKIIDMMRNILHPIKALSKISSNPQQICIRLASTVNAGASPIYELRMYSFNPKDFKSAMELFNKYNHMRLKHSKLFGFWTAEIGDHVTQFVHIWEYDSLSHRRKVRTGMAGDEVWNTQFLPVLMPTVAQWKNALTFQSPGTNFNLDFTKDASAVYLLDQISVKNYQDLSELSNSNDAEVLVARFCGFMGTLKTEYRLWRYAQIDEANEAAKKRAMEEPFEGSTMLMYPTKFSPLQ